MKHPAQRFTLSLGKKNGYASYRNWVYSILDYALWQQRYAAALTEEEYLAYLSRVYASDTHYVTKIKRIANTLKES
jgi:flagellum-specific peptidoglycan hydrolase FlgJ